MEKRKNILFLTPRMPYPLIGGDRIKSYHLLLHMAQEHNVTLVTFLQGDNDIEKYHRIFASIGIKSIIIPLRPIKAAFDSFILNKTLSPLEIRYYTQPDFKVAVDKLLSQEHFDICFSFFMRTAEYLKNVEGTKKVLISEDCRTLYQMRSYRESENVIQRFARYFDYRTLRRYEPAIMPHFDMITFVTNRDINEMKKMFPAGNYRLLTNGTDIDTFCMPPEDTVRSGILFSGKLDTWANILMVRKIAGEIMPEIWKKFPEERLTIVGANPGREIKNLASDKIEIVPNVPSVVPFLQSAKIFVHPHKGGTGIQNKLLEAMACGLPVVTTDIGNQGIDARDGEEIMLAETTNEVLRKTFKLLENKELRDAIALNARALIERTHSWDVIYKALDQIIESLS